MQEPNFAIEKNHPHKLDFVDAKYHFCHYKNDYGKFACVAAKRFALGKKTLKRSLVWI